MFFFMLKFRGDLECVALQWLNHYWCPSWTSWQKGTAYVSPDNLFVRQRSAGSFGVASSGSITHLHSRLCCCCFHHQLQVPSDWRADPQASYPDIQEELPPKPQGTTRLSAVIVKRPKCSVFNISIFKVMGSNYSFKITSLFLFQQQCLTASKFVAHLINQNVVCPVSSLEQCVWVLRTVVEKLSLILRPMRYCVLRCSLCCWSARPMTAWRFPSPSWRSVDSNWRRCPREALMVHWSYHSLADKLH